MHSQPHMNSLLTPFLNFTAVFTTACIDLTTPTIHSSNFTYLNFHHITTFRYLIKRFSQIHKCQPQFFFRNKYLSCICYIIKMAPVLPFPGPNPDCIPSLFTPYLIFTSISRSKSFITWSSNFIPRYEPHSGAWLLTMYTIAIKFLSLSESTIWSACTLHS